jgi:hypothetical protein
MVDNINQDKQNNYLSKNHLSNNTNRLVLQCLHKTATPDQIQNNITWEKYFRNTKLRKDLPNTSLIYTYSGDNIIETLKGQSKSIHHG